MGGSHIHAHGSGCVDNEVATEDEAFAQIRAFLGYLPSNVWQLPPRRDTDDDAIRCEADLLSIIPRDRRRGYNARRLVEMIVDHDSFFEISRYYGRPLIAGLARLNGYAVGVMANDPHFGDQREL